MIEALAAAHKAGVIHGAVHPRSVLIDEDGGVRLSDFVVGRALTTAVAQGADSSLWRGLTGYIAPELVVGEDPTPGVDVFAVGAMLFTMLSGEVAAGLAARHARGRAARAARARYRRLAPLQVRPTDLLENLLEAMEDDRWELADRGELIKEAGLSRDRHEHRRRDRGSARVARQARRRAGHATPSGDLARRGHARTRDTGATGSTRCSPISATTTGHDAGRRAAVDVPARSDQRHHPPRSAQARGDRVERARAVARRSRRRDAAAAADAATRRQ